MKMAKPKPVRIREVQTRSRSGRFPLDQLLRDYGFRILYRRQKEYPIWTRNGMEYMQSEAVAQLPPQLVVPFIEVPPVVNEVA
jgi:hypothetical protein